jgi:hypothetical protein
MSDNGNGNGNGAPANGDGSWVDPVDSDLTRSRTYEFEVGEDS